MMLFASDVLSRSPGAVVIFDVKSTTHLPRIVKERGGRPLMWKTGHSLIKAKMKEVGALLAGEMSGHIFFKERWFGFDDGLYAGARLLEVLSRDTRPPSSVFADLPDAVNTPEIRVDLPEGENYRLMQTLVHTRFAAAEVNTIDGLRADFEDGWGLVRASNSMPALVLRFEARTPQALRRIQDEFRRALLEASPTLKLPF
jgi:phosphomannomutase/phosphoglucomutase